MLFVPLRSNVRATWMHNISNAIKAGPLEQECGRVKSQSLYLTSSTSFCYNYLLVLHISFEVTLAV